MGVEPSRRTIVQLKIGAVGYVVGAAAWSLFWLAIAGPYVGGWASYLRYIAFFAVSISLIMVGIGCFALGKLYVSQSAVTTGFANIIGAVLFFVMGFMLLPFSSWPFLYWHPGLIALIGYGFLTIGLFLWAFTALDITHSSFRRLGIAVGATSLVSAFIFLLLLPIVARALLGLIIPAFFAQPYVLAQVLSTLLLRKISSDTRRDRSPTNANP